MVGVMGPRIDEDCESRVGEDIGREVVVEVAKWVDTCGMARIRFERRQATVKRAEEDYLSMILSGVRGSVWRLLVVELAGES